MPRRIPRITAGHVAVLIATAALFVAVDGPTHAAAVITGANIQNNSVASKDIKNNTIKGGDVKDDGLTGADVVESSLAKVPSATTADTAASATTVTDNAITGAKVADGSLTAADIALASGRLTVDLDSVAANSCDYNVVTLKAGVDFRTSAIVATPGPALNELDVSVTVGQSDSVGLARVVLCNPTNAAINPVLAGSTIDWIAFKVG